MYADRECAYNFLDEATESPPLMAVMNEGRLTLAAKIPSIGEMIFGWEKLFPLVIRAVTQAVWLFVLFEKMRKSARPSKSGIVNAIAIIALVIRL